MEYNTQSLVHTTFTLALLATVVGCTHTQLWYNTVNQAETVADVHTQQVLDNLAKFAHNPNALPHFSFPNSGLAQVTDNARGNTRFDFSPRSLSTWFFGVDGSRTNAESYTLTPVNDPRKLELMRCAYQRAISACGCQSESTHCPDCNRRFNQFYLGSETTSLTPEITYNGENVFRVKNSVKLIHYPPSESGYVELNNSGPGTLLVTAERNDLNEVTYRYLRSEGVVDQSPPNRAKLFKLQSVEVTEPSEFRLFVELLERNPEFKSVVRIISGRIQLSPDKVIEMYHSEEIAPPNGSNDEAANSVDDEASSNESRRVMIEYSFPTPLAPEDLERVYTENTVAEFTSRTGHVTVACPQRQCWFQVVSRKHALKCLCGGYVGHHSGTYVWVPPGGRDDLTRLTLTILDIAINEPADRAAIEVYALLNEDGEVASAPRDASFLLKGRMPRGTSPSSILPSTPSPESPENELERKLLAETVRIAREGFLMEVSRNEITDILRTLGPATGTTVEYVTANFEIRAIDIRDGDELVRVAAQYPLAKFAPWRASDSVNELFEKSKTAEFPIKLDRALLFLNAVYDSQKLTGKTPALIRNTEPESRRSPDSFPGGVLNEVQQLQQFQGTFFNTPTAPF